MGTKTLLGLPIKPGLPPSKGRPKGLPAGATKGLGKKAKRARKKTRTSGIAGKYGKKKRTKAKSPPKRSRSQDSASGEETKTNNSGSGPECIVLPDSDSSKPRLPVAATTGHLRSFTIW